jgi:two-component system, chemotaxis family, protein-glutamate methylesterase/glutaminase
MDKPHAPPPRRLTRSEPDAARVLLTDRAMANRNLFVIGSSLGGVQALQRLLRQLPAGLEASLFVVQHTSQGTGLHGVLGRSCALPVRTAEDGQQFEPGVVYVAPADRHLLLEAKTLQVVRGPRENSVRPAIDPLFRSAAAHHGPRVVGIVLTGLRDDGTAGLRAIHRCGGVTVVQDPADAAFPEMPESALRFVAVDHVVPITEMGQLIVQLAQEPAPEVGPPPEDIVREAAITARFATSSAPIEQLGQMTQLDCPECAGPLWEIADGDPGRFRCRLGHAFSVTALAAQQGFEIERALLVAMRTLEERSRMLDRLHLQAQGIGRGIEAARFAQDRDEANAHADVLRALLGSF